MMLREGSVGAKGKMFLDEVINMACDIGNLCTTTATESGMSPFEKLSGNSGSLKELPSVGTVGLFRGRKRRSELDPHDTKCVMLGRARHYPDGCVGVLNLKKH